MKLEEASARNDATDVIKLIICFCFLMLNIAF